jgi:hypothetical protein
VLVLVGRGLAVALGEDLTLAGVLVIVAPARVAVVCGATGVLT